MNRWIGTVLLAGVASVALSQAPFTIVRPVDNARVREKVRILIPKDSVPPGGYIGVFLGDKFVQATVPPVKGQYREFILDTKGRGIPDTEKGRPLKLELVLYVDFNDQPRIVDRSSIDINIGNKANIPMPNAGIKLRYAFRPGAQMVYTMQQRVSISSISEAQAKAGGKAAELPLDSEKIRLLYAVDNAYGDGDGLVRLQPLPLKGKDYAFLTTSDSEGPKRYEESEMAPIYMRVTSTGRQEFGSVPAYFPLEGTSGQGSLLDLLGVFPLPTLPERAVRPGDSWQSRFQEGRLNLNDLYNQTSLVRSLPARGEFLGVEWEMGHPCAKLRNSLQTSGKDRATGTESKRRTTETIWFALDSRKVLKIVRDEIMEGKFDPGAFGLAGAQGTGGGGQAPGSGSAGPIPGGNASGGPVMGGASGGGGRGRDDERVRGGDLRQRSGPPGLPGAPGGRPGQAGGSGAPGTQGGGLALPGRGGGGFPGAAAGGAGNTVVQIRIQRIFVLES